MWYFLRFFTWNQFLKQTNYRKCLQHFSTAANVKHLTALLVSRAGVRSCGVLEGVTDARRNGPLGIGVERAGECHRAARPVRARSLRAPPARPREAAREAGQRGAQLAAPLLPGLGQFIAPLCRPRKPRSGSPRALLPGAGRGEGRAQPLGPASSLPPCECAACALLLCSWVWIRDVMGTSVSFFMWRRCTGAWQRAAGTWGFKALRTVGAVLPYGKRRQWWWVWVAEAGEELCLPSTSDTESFLG